MLILISVLFNLSKRPIANKHGRNSKKLLVQTWEKCSWRKEKSWYIIRRFQVWIYITWMFKRWSVLELQLQVSPDTENPNFIGEIQPLPPSQGTFGLENPLQCVPQGNISPGPSIHCQWIWGHHTPVLTNLPQLGLQPRNCCTVKLSLHAKRVKF